MNENVVIDKTIVGEFINAVKKVMNISAGEDIVNHEVFLDKSHDLPGDISAKIGLTGDLRGTVAVSFPMEYARLITSNIISCEPDELTDEEVREGMGEVVNQVTGKVRTDLWNYGYRFNISIPEIINAPIHQIATNEVLPVHIVVFESTKATFSVQINIQETNII